MTKGRWILLGAITALAVGTGVGAAGGLTTLYQLMFKQSGTGATARTARSKVADFVSVMDFGAVGDGVTNDTVAVTAAIAYAGDFVNVHFPCPNTYLTTTWGTIPCGYQELVPSTGAVPRPLGTKIQEFLSAKDFGAVGDGVTDDTSAIGNLLNAAASTQLVNLPCPGTYISSTYGTLACGIYYPPRAATGSTLRAVAPKLLDTISVKDFGCVGDGVAVEDTCLANARAYAASLSSAVAIVFPAGTYKYGTAPNWNLRGLRLVGDGRVTLSFTGTGNAWRVDFGSPPNALLNFDVGMDNFTISGNASATNGLYVSGCDHCVFRNINITNVTAAGLYVLRNTVSLFENIRVSDPENPFTTIPVNGILVDQNAAGQQSAACSFISSTIEGVSGSGIKLNTNGVLRSLFIGGTVEGGSTRGIQILSGNSGNVFEDLDLEGNTVEDISISGSQNSFIGMLAISNLANDTHLLSGAIGNTFIGGLYGSVTFDAGANANTFSAVHGQNSGAWTDSGTGNIRVGTYNVNGAVYEPLIIPNGTSNAAQLGDPLANTITLSNNQYLKFKDTGGTARPFMTRGSDDNFYFGDTSASSNSFFFQNKSGVNVLTLRTDASAVLASVTFANLPGSPNASLIFCSDCTPTQTCAGSGTGALAIHNNSIWSCNGGGFPEATVALTYSATIATDASLGSVFSITATNGTAFTISNPTNLRNGQRVTYVIRNTSGGALGAVTWGTGTFKMGTWASPATGFSRSIGFNYDGTNLVEASRNTIDVPN